ncbi:MAG TPA: NAD(P)-binding domain-containing protein [Myxococcota bacterium]|nr:NAD(P)-binding domain-containing protein [Myxococcota bacterium]
MSEALILYGALLLLTLAPYAWLRHRRTARSLALLDASRAAGLTEPVSLHPRIDASRCIGCATCVAACPEEEVLGLVRGKAVLVNPADCIGHGACQEACPTDAIELVLGSETRGVDIPVLGADFQTNVPGLFVAGELGGMGLIRNAIEQGRQAIDSVRRMPGIGAGDGLDIVIVGAGPAGFSATLAAREHGLRAVTLEQETLGGTVAHYPRGKIVMTRPALLPLHGRMKLRETSKESLLAFFRDVEKRQGIQIRYQERVEAIRRTPGGFEITTTRGRYASRAVLLTVGRRGTPRTLGVPGEEREKVVYRLLDPAQYRGRSVLVVGGGDSALEAALALCEEPGVDATLSYRGAAFTRCKPKNRERVATAAKARRLRVLLESEVKEIRDESVLLVAKGGPLELPNDAVIVCAGGILPTAFLESIGVAIETKHGTA